MNYKLTDLAIKGLRPAGKQYKVSDGGGLVVDVTPSGSKFFRYQYRFGGRQRVLTLGEYPSLSLKEARRLHLLAWEKVKLGIDPAPERTRPKAGPGGKGEAPKVMTFKELAGLHMAARQELAPRTILAYQGLLINHLLPTLGDMPVTEIKAQDITAITTGLRDTGRAHSAREGLGLCRRIIRWGIAELGLGDIGLSDVTAPLSVTAPPPKGFAFIEDQALLGGLLADIDAWARKHPITGPALQLAPLLALRPGELAGLQWAEVDLDKAEIIIPASRMKGGRDHWVPLSTQALGILKGLQDPAREKIHVFPGQGEGGPISVRSMAMALRYMGYPGDTHTMHGFRKVFSTWANESGYNWDWIERQLSHVPGGVRGIYNKAQYAEGRRKMMQDYSDYLYSLKEEAAHAGPRHGRAR
jgi:integrase